MGNIPEVPQSLQIWHCTSLRSISRTLLQLPTLRIVLNAEADDFDDQVGRVTRMMIRCGGAAISDGSNSPPAQYRYVGVKEGMIGGGGEIVRSAACHRCRGPRLNMIVVLRCRLRK